MKPSFLSFFMLCLTFSATAFADKTEQCLLVRDEYKKFDLEIPSRIPIATKAGWQAFETNKKVSTYFLRQIKLARDNGNRASIKMRNNSTGEEFLVHASAHNYLNGIKTDESSYYGSDILPTILIETGKDGSSVENEISTSGNSLSIANKGIQISVIPCSEQAYIQVPEANVSDSQDLLLELKPTVMNYGGGQKQ